MNNQTLKIQESPCKDLPVLALMTFVLFAIKAVWAVLISTGPTIVDELLYKFNASTIFDLQKYYTAHYPPAYSLVLAPALFFKDWYEAMLVVNAFLSSLVVPASWFLARSAGIKRPMLAAVLSALLPMHFVFPNILFSENLFVTLFVLAVAIALRGGKRGYIEALAFGFVLGVAHLTKYLFLPALPLLIATWLYCRRTSNQENASETSVSLYIPFLLVLLGYGLVVGLWLYYGGSSGFSLSQMFGLGFAKVFGIGASGIKTKTLNADSFLMWVVAYISYLVLAWLPIWGVIAIWMSQVINKDWRIQIEPRHQRFLYLVLLLVSCYWLLAVRYSFGCGYNYPVPQRVMGRYVMQLFPIMLVVGVWIMEIFAESRAKFHKIKALFAIAMLVGVASIAWWILFNKGIWAFNEWFANRTPGTVDVVAMASLQVFLLAIAMISLLLAMISFRRNDIRLLVLPIVTLMLVSMIVAAGRMYVYQDGLHFRELAAAVTSLKQQNETLHILYEDNVLNRPFLKERMLFWGVKQNQLSAESVSAKAGINFDSLSSPTLLLTRMTFDIKPDREYLVNGKTYYIYRVDGLDPNMLQSFIKDVK